MKVLLTATCALLLACGCHHKAPPQARADSPAPMLGTGAGMPPAMAAGAEPSAPVISGAGEANLDDYQVRPSDLLDIDVFQEPDLKTVARVSENGTIAFPLIGAVAVAGQTPLEVARTLETRLGPGYLINPQVSVRVEEFAKQSFTVLGEVQHPGLYDFPDRQTVTVLQAIGLAGGYTRIANPSKVTVMRRIGSPPETFLLNARKMASGRENSSFIVHPGDVITVAESAF